MGQIIYKGSYPAPKYNHGDTIKNHGIVLGRTRLNRGWEYRCKINNITLYYYESD